MRLNVLTELRQPIGSISTSDIGESSLTVDGLVIRGLDGTVRTLRTDRGLLVSVNASGTVREACSRCLKDLECSLAVSFEEEYVPVVDANTGARVRADVAPDAFRISPDFTLDLQEGVRQYLLMAEPAKPLCRTDCRGLCATCGTDLNNSQCDCGESRDERWRALAGLNLSQRKGK